MGYFHSGTISAFGSGQGKIGMILIVNLDRQPRRLERTLRELNRFRSSDGASLVTLTRRHAAIDARDGRAVAATADVDPSYLLSNQLFVQPNAWLEECFDANEHITMTRQEVAIARSHIEVWKTIASGSCDHVLVLEDDIWFRRGAAASIDRGWHAAAKRFAERNGPKLLYFSYENAGGTAARAEVCETLFRPERGLWFLSGYVLSREGAKTLLRSMPVVGPVDMWINYQFNDLNALALSSPAILQRPDERSDNRYSVLPYLAKAGVVDANAVDVPNRASSDPILAWTSGNSHEALAMALSMLGLRVRAFDRDENKIPDEDLATLLETFDVLVDPPISDGAISTAIVETNAKFVIETSDGNLSRVDRNRLPRARTLVLQSDELSDASWQPLCALLGLAPPIQAFPVGPPREWRLFRDDRAKSKGSLDIVASSNNRTDDSAWVLVPRVNWPSQPVNDRHVQSLGKRLVHGSLTTASPLFAGRVETFPGNLAIFVMGGLSHDSEGARLQLSKANEGIRPYRSGAFASGGTFEYGRFQAEIKAAHGSGLVTGFFLHRDAPRQEIDIELIGDAAGSMLVNVYFNPGDDGATLNYGYRGSPCRIELGFDSTLDFHLYAIDWRPGHISWSVDGRIVHERVGWDPTPVPHLPMRLHANLWAPRSEELGGRIDEQSLPSTATIRNVSIWT